MRTATRQEVGDVCDVETYQIGAVCSNCHHFVQVRFPMGTLVKLNETKCNKCGCKTLKRQLLTFADQHDSLFERIFGRKGL